MASTDDGPEGERGGEQQGYPPENFYDYEDDGYDDYEDYGGYNDYAYDAEPTHPEAQHTPVSDDRRQPRTGFENRYATSSFANRDPNHWYDEEENHGFHSEHCDDEARRYSAADYNLAGNSSAPQETQWFDAYGNRVFDGRHNNFEMDKTQSATWPRVWLWSRYSPPSWVYANSLVDTGNKTGLHFISLTMFDTLGHDRRDMDSSNVTSIERVENAYQTLGSIDLDLSVQITESDDIQYHTIRFHVVSDGVIDGYHIVFAEEPRIGLRTEPQGVLLMITLSKTKETEAERRKRKEREKQRQAEKEKEREKREKQREKDKHRYKEKSKLKDKESKLREERKRRDHK